VASKPGAARLSNRLRGIFYQHYFLQHAQKHAQTLATRGFPDVEKFFLLQIFFARIKKPLNLFVS
jgi:hypothetical protein